MKYMRLLIILLLSLSGIVTIAQDAVVVTIIIIDRFENDIIFEVDEDQLIGGDPESARDSVPGPYDDSENCVLTQEQGFRSTLTSITTEDVGFRSTLTGSGIPPLPHGVAVETLIQSLINIHEIYVNYPHIDFDIQRIEVDNFTTSAVRDQLDDLISELPQGRKIVINMSFVIVPCEIFNFWSEYKAIMASEVSDAPALAEFFDFLKNESGIDSFDLDTDDPLLQAISGYCEELEGMFYSVGAAGNDGLSFALYPAALPEVISVGALTSPSLTEFNVGSLAGYSNGGANVDVLRPGDYYHNSNAGIAADLGLATAAQNGNAANQLAQSVGMYRGTSYAAPRETFLLAVGLAILESQPGCIEAQDLSNAALENLIDG